MINGNNLQGSIYSVQEITQRIEIEVEDFVMADENATGFAISGSYTLFRAAEDDPDPVMPETASSETASPESVMPGETNADWQEIYYERYYAIWDSEETMLSEIENRSVYRENCFFYNDAVYYIEGGGGYMMKTDISYLVEPLYPTDLVYTEEELRSAI